MPDQSYGYAWPMGPFFALGHLVDMPPWMIQRLWWALLLCVAFFGMLRLCERLMLGSELTRVVAAFAFVLTPRLTTLGRGRVRGGLADGAGAVGPAAAGARVQARGPYAVPPRPARSSSAAAAASTPSRSRPCSRSA